MPVHRRDPQLQSDIYTNGATAPKLRSRQEELSAPQHVNPRRKRLEAEPASTNRSSPERSSPERSSPERPSPEQQRRTQRRHVKDRQLEQVSRQMKTDEEQRQQEKQRQIEREKEQAKQTIIRMNRQRAGAAICILAFVLTIASGAFIVLQRNATIDALIVQTRQVQATIDNQIKRNEELEVELNTQGNIAQIQDYAKENLNMDYVDKENVRVIILP